MKWSSRGRSRDLEDRRGARPVGFGGGRIGRVAPIGLGGLLLLAVLTMVTGQDFLGVTSDPAPAGPGTPYESTPYESAPPSTTPEEEKLVDFVSYVLDDAQNMWAGMLPGYQRAQLVLYRDATHSGCGVGQAATGPFYCPVDGKVYVDLSFYTELRRRFGASGDFAQAYVLAHEIGHHVQALMGTDREVRRAQQARPDQANPLSVRMELQADCYAGIWGHSAARRGTLDPGDVEEGLGAAAAIGDDRLTGGRVAPDQFTHGSAADRVAWFRRGLQTGQLEACDTFAR
jgi:predicted metalloprotease